MRYAKALIEYAKGTGAEDRVYHELRMLERSFRKHPDLREAVDQGEICSDLYCCRRQWRGEPGIFPLHNTCVEKPPGVLFAVHLPDLS